MTATPQSRPRPLAVAQPAPLSLGLLCAGAAAVLAGQPAWSVVPAGGVLLWGIREAGSPSETRRVRGHATALAALAFLLAVSMPVFLSPALDQLTLVALVADALLVIVIASPSARRALRPRRVSVRDFNWWAFSLSAALAVSLAVRPVALQGTDAERASIALLVIVVPLLNEVLLRGLLMHGAAGFVRGVVPAALVQGCVSAALFGWVGLAIGSALGVALGAIRLQGGWQASLFAHWGLALGVAVPLLMGVR